MRQHQYGALLKRRPHAGITLHTNESYRRLTAHLQDLIICTYERCTSTPSKSLYLEKLEFVSAVESGGKFSMRLNVLVKELEHGAAIPLRLTFTADPEDIEC